MATQSQIISWKSYQRKDYREGRLSKSRIAKLERIPGWLWEIPDTAKNNKQELLEMAKKKESRPSHQRHPLGSALGRYTRKLGVSYDPDFDKEIRKLATHWFVDTTKNNKQELLEMAKRREPRPKRGKGTIGQALSNYICESGVSYDPDFDKEIRSIAKHWFIDTTKPKKQELLELAKKGESRPNQKKNPLGSSLSSYTGKSCKSYDPDFDKKIRKIAPHWFRSKKRT